MNFLRRICPLSGVVLLPFMISACAERTDVSKIEQSALMTYVDTSSSAAPSQVGDGIPQGTVVVGGNVTTITSFDEQTGLQTVTTQTKIKNVLELRNVRDLTTVVMRTGDAYLELSDLVATGESRAGLAVIGLAAAGAGVLLTGGSSSSLEYIGLSAAMLQQGRSYLEPAETAKALTAAAESSFCIASASQRHVNGTDGMGSEAFQLIANAYLQNKIHLRNKMTRGEFPDYSALLKEAQNAQTDERGDKNTSKSDIPKLASALSKCPLKA